MTETDELLRIRELARRDPACMDKFLRALLSAPLFVQTLTTHLNPRCWRMPSNGAGHRERAIHIFTNPDDARNGIDATVSILSIGGSDLLGSFPGATWHVDPNDGGVILYPSDVAEILGLPPPQELLVQASDPAVELQSPRATDVILASKVARVARREFGATEFYLAPARLAGSEGPPDRLRLMVVVANESAERCAEGLAAAIDLLAVKPRLPVEITILRPGCSLPLGFRRATRALFTHDGRCGPATP